MGLGFVAGLVFVLMSDTLLTVINKHRVELDRLQEDGDKEFHMCLSDDFEAFLLQRMQVSKVHPHTLHTHTHTHTHTRTHAHTLTETKSISNVFDPNNSLPRQA